MHRFLLVLLTAATPLLVGLALAGCGSPAPDAAGPAASSPAVAQPALPSTSTAPTTAASGPSTGRITFTGALSGSMTVSACHAGMAQLVVAVDGQDVTYAGLIDTDDFTFAVPHSTGYTLADATTKPTVSGTTYTVRNTKLVSITNDDTVTVNGSVACP